MTRLLVVILLLASLAAALSINTISKMVVATPPFGHQSYWTPMNVTAPSGMKVQHVIFNGTDSTFKLGNTGLKACIENANDKGGTILCHPVIDIPISKNGTLGTGYFITPKTNETLYASGQVDFNGIRAGTQIDGFETHLNLPSNIYSVAA